MATQTVCTYAKNVARRYYLFLWLAILILLCNVRILDDPAPGSIRTKDDKAAYARFEEAIDEINNKLVIALCTLLVGFQYFVITEGREKTKIFIELFKECNRRYDDLKTELSTVISDIKNADDAASLTGKNTVAQKILTDKHKGVLDKYFNLCAEEYLFYEKGYIDQPVWDAWCKGMMAFHDINPIAEYWAEELSSNSHYGFPLNKIVQKYKK